MGCRYLKAAKALGSFAVYLHGFYCVCLIISEHSLNPNSSLWDMDYERLLHSKKTLPGTMGSYEPSSLFRSRLSPESLGERFAKSEPGPEATRKAVFL